MATKPKRKKGEKWGPKFEDKRIWPEYNEQLVVRGEFLLDLDWVKSWNEELETMNKNKKGHPYEFPESLIHQQAVWNQWISLRGIEGMTRQVTKTAGIPDYNDYSTISRRIRKIDTSFQLPKHGFCSVSTDGTGMKMHQTGEYRTDKYGGKKRRWIKVVITANPLTGDLLDLDVSMDGEGQSEPDIAIQHMNNLWNYGIIIDKFWGDGSYDVIDLYNLLEEHHTESAIPPRDDASKNANGSMRRVREVFEYQTQEWDDWAISKSYGKRWLGTECIFSAVKRIFSENTRAKKPETACKEAERKFWAYETMRKYAQA